jgi:hypothetical protein
VPKLHHATRQRIAEGGIAKSLRGVPWGSSRGTSLGLVSEGYVVQDGWSRSSKIKENKVDNKKDDIMGGRENAMGDSRNKYKSSAPENCKGHYNVTPSQQGSTKCRQGGS